eukprot:s4612_g2.t1
MGLLGGYDSEESSAEGASASTKPSGAAASKPAATAQAEEESSDEEDEPEAKRTKLTGHPLGLLAPKFAQKDAGPKAGSPATAAMAFVPSQVRKKGRVVSTVTDNISDRSFANSKSS